MRTRRIAILVLGFALMLCGCDDGGGEIKSGEGESCTKTADCEDGLKCFDLICEAPEEDTVSAQLCTPGINQDCACEGGGTGAQTCLPDGLSWSFCAPCIPSDE